MAASKSTKWADKIEKAAAAYNKTGNDEALYGQAPNEVKDDKVLQFRLMQDNGKKFAQNAKQLKQRQEKLMQNAGFGISIATEGTVTQEQLKRKEMQLHELSR